MDEVPVVPIVPVKSKSHKKKGKGPEPIVKSDDTDKPFITIVRPPGGVLMSVTS